MSRFHCGMISTRVHLEAIVHPDIACIKFVYRYLEITSHSEYRSLSISSFLSLYRQQASFVRSASFTRVPPCPASPPDPSSLSHRM